MPPIARREQTGARILGRPLRWWKRRFYNQGMVGVASWEKRSSRFVIRHSRYTRTQSTRFHPVPAHLPGFSVVYRAHKSDGPIFDTEAGDTVELAAVVRHQSQVVGKRDGGDDEIVAADDDALPFEVIADVGVLSHAGRVERE